LNPGVGVLLDQKHWRNRQVWKQSDELTQVRNSPKSLLFISAGNKKHR